ncbi:MAG: hypothetical protein Q8O67_16395 [Deltaproteobacteria bacterium]|nr:hypothetical protein [Deltaproteobacteria bacterium]
MRVLFSLVFAVALSGCCALDDTCQVAADTGEGIDDNGDVALTSPGCDPKSIAVEGAVVCADCAFANDSICGAPNEALCEVRENSFGDACQLCVTADGVILYDDCFTGAAARESALCEESASDNADEVCKVCFDDDGNTVSTTCGPRADECSEVTGADGRLCTRCTANGEVVSNDCESVDIDPSLCRAYGNDLGQCVDCFDDDNALLSHSCTPSGGGVGFVSCEQTVSPDGLACTVCVDENGTTVERSCDQEIQPEPERCGQLVFTEQTCIVCVDDLNAVVFIDCQRNGCVAVDDTVACRLDSDCAAGQACFDGTCVAQNSGAPPPPDDDPNAPEPAPPEVNICEPPPACTMDVGSDGAVCRTCPVTTSDGLVGSETRCVSAGLACEVVPETSTDGDGTNDLAPPPEDPQGSNCVVCKDTGSGVVVYEDCGNGSVPPPYCLNEDTGDGTQCSVCFDAVTDAPIYTSCGDETCFALESQVLIDGEQAPLLVAGEPATVACKQCGDADVNAPTSEEAAAAFSAICSLENVCQDPFGSSFAACPATTTLTIAPHSCENPWDVWAQAGEGDVGLLQSVIAFALGERGLTIVAASVVVDAGAGCDACTCETGMRIELLVPEADADVVAALFEGFVIR